MPRKSTVTALLPPADLRDLNEMIGSGRYTLDGLVEWLAERGFTLSRSALHRHGIDVRKVAEKLQQSREVTQALVAELGDAAAQGKQGRLLVEMARSIVFDLLMKLQTAEGDAPALTPMDVAMLGKGLAELGRALRYDQDFETKIREQVEKETKKAVAAEVETVAKEKGLSADTVKAIKSRILGVKVPS
ncbi:MAG: DUF3486 family protein [Rhodospirillales bacterium]|nr:DUF3486 family protein [Rhodospirillales bacterium]